MFEDSFLCTIYSDEFDEKHIVHITKLSIILFSFTENKVERKIISSEIYEKALSIQIGSIPVSASAAISQAKIPRESTENVQRKTQNGTSMAETLIVEPCNVADPPTAEAMKSKPKYSRTKEFVQFLNGYSRQELKRNCLKVEEDRHKARVAKYAEFLSEADICQLDSIIPSASKDSEFIRTCLRLLYKNDATILRKKSLRGRQYVTPKTKEKSLNSAISPLKTNVIRNLFLERVISSGQNMEFRQQCEYMNSRITNSLSYMERKF